MKQFISYSSIYEAEFTLIDSENREVVNFFSEHCVICTDENGDTWLHFSDDTERTNECLDVIAQLGGFMRHYEHSLYDFYIPFKYVSYINFNK